MGLLDDLLGQLGGGGGRGRRAPLPPTRGGGMGGGLGGGMGGNMGMGRVLIALLPVVLSMLARRRRQGQPGQGDLGAGAGSGGMGGGVLGDILGGVLGGAGGSLGRGTGAGSNAGGIGMGGLGELLDRFERAGFGKQAHSWVSTGQNEGIAPDAVETAFGRDAIEEIAQQAGLSAEETAQGLSQLLPEVVNEVTPEGAVPDPDRLSASLDDLIRRAKSGELEGWDGGESGRPPG
jgi:uncharacterized protein YidB (DUF937 family)